VILVDGMIVWIKCCWKKWELFKRSISL